MRLRAICVIYKCSEKIRKNGDSAPSLTDNRENGLDKI